MGMFIFVMVIILFVVVYQRKMLEKQNEINLLEQTRQISEFKAVVEAQENEKEKIASNLHDEIGPMLTVLKLNMSKHQSDLRKGRSLENDAFAEDISRIDSVMENIRSTCHDLTPNFLLEFGLVKTLEQFVCALESSGKLSTTFSVANEQPLRLGKQDTINLYRVCMELINNLLKHASCQKMTFEMGFSDEELMIRITHDGNGLTQESFDELSTSRNGLGLKSLKSRILMMKAKLEFQRNPKASIIEVKVPTTDVSEYSNSNS